MKVSDVLHTNSARIDYQLAAACRRRARSPIATCPQSYVSKGPPLDGSLSTGRAARAWLAAMSLGPTPSLTGRRSPPPSRACPSARCGRAHRSSRRS